MGAVHQDLVWLSKKWWNKIRCPIECHLLARKTKKTHLLVWSLIFLQRPLQSIGPYLHRKLRWPRTTALLRTKTNTGKEGVWQRKKTTIKIPYQNWLFSAPKDRCSSLGRLILVVSSQYCYLPFRKSINETHQITHFYIINKRMTRKTLTRRGQPMKFPRTIKNYIFLSVCLPPAVADRDRR